MIYSVKGEVVHKEPMLAVIECGGVGYSCRTTANTLGRITVGEEAKLYTYLYVRESVIELFGFAETSELNCFKQLLSVSGVGTKGALAILSDITPSELALCIAKGDSGRLNKAKGIGVKTAQRIVLELKDKVAKEQKTQNIPVMPAETVSGSNTYSEALSALCVLGFSVQQAREALSGAPEELSVEELIKFALKRL